MSLLKRGLEAEFSGDTRCSSTSRCKVVRGDGGEKEESEKLHSYPRWADETWSSQLGVTGRHFVKKWLGRKAFCLQEEESVCL